MRLEATAVCIVVLGTITAVPARAATGGPDSIGYVFSDSTEAGGPAYAFEDISTSGTPITFDYYGNAGVPLPFPFTFYDETHTGTIYVNGYGLLTFDYDYYGYYNYSIPTTFPPNDLVAGWWGSLDFSSGTFRYRTLGTAPNRRFVVLFKDVPACYYYCDLATFEFKLYERTNAIEVHYQSAPGGGYFGYTHVAGIENGDGTVGLQYASGTAALATPLAVRYVQVPAPSAPALTGPSSSRAGESIEIGLVSTDPSGYGVAYTIDWGDGSRSTRLPASGFATQGQQQLAAHIFGSVGTYHIAARATNALGRTSAESSLDVDVVNEPPGAPSTPAGPPIGTTILEVEFTTSATDPEADPVAYFFDWGDGSPAHRVPAAGFLTSGARATARHHYSRTGTFSVGSWAEDLYGSAGPPSAAAPIQVLL